MTELSIQAPGSDSINAEYSSLFNIHPIVIDILRSRGYETPKQLDAFLNPRLSDIRSPFMLKGMYEAVARIRRAIDSQELIGIFADSDLDGITSMALLHELFTRIGIAPFVRCLRGEETYGMSREIVDEYADMGVGLIITVDAGIRDIKEISYARSRNIDVIVTDHHEPEHSLPDAIIVNPKNEADDYPFRDLAGVGVAMKLALGLLMSYLPSFKRHYCLIALVDGGYDEGFEYAVIQDGVEHRGGVVTNEDLSKELDALDRDAVILISPELKRSKNIHAIIGRSNAIDFQEFLARVPVQNASSLNGRCLSHESGSLTAMVRRFQEAQISGSPKIFDFLESVLGLVSIGSIADVVPLVDENRIMVHHGIRCLNERGHASIDLLIGDAPVSARSIGWTIGPLLNTPGRTGKTELAVRFFLEREHDELKKLIDEIRSLNQERKDHVAAECNRIIAEMDVGAIPLHRRMVYIKLTDIPDGFAGLIANRIADLTGKPVIAVVFPGREGLVKGSGRSRKGINFFSHIERFRDLFDRIGGHENAFGFTVRADAIDEIIDHLDESLANSPSPDKGEREVFEIRLEDITEALIRDIKRMEPFGNGNEEPIFSARYCRFHELHLFGSQHGRFVVAPGNPLTAVGWGMASLMREMFESRRPLDVVFRLENNVYNGLVYPRMILTEICLSE